MRRIPACIQVFAASLLLSEIWIIPRIIPAVSLRKEGTLEVPGRCRWVPDPAALWIFQFWSRRSPHGEVSVAQWTSALDF